MVYQCTEPDDEPKPESLKGLSLTVKQKEKLAEKLSIHNFWKDLAVEIEINPSVIIGSLPPGSSPADAARKLVDEFEKLGDDALIRALKDSGMRMICNEFYGR